MKKIILTLLPILLLSYGLGIAKADTRTVVFTNNAIGTSDLHALSFQVNYFLPKEKYAPGEKIYPVVTYSMGHITCSNGVDIDKTIYTRPQSEIGAPDTSTFIYRKTISEPPTYGIYYNTVDKKIYDSNGNNVLSADTNLGYDMDGDTILENSIDYLWVEGGILKGRYQVECTAYEFDCGYDQETGLFYKDKNGNITSLPGINDASYIDFYTPYIYNTQTSENPIKGGTYVYGYNNLSSVVKVPSNAKAGNYTFLLAINPSWTNSVNTSNVTTGDWNNYQANLPKIKNKILSLLNAFKVEKAEAQTQDPTCGTMWYCDIQFYSIPMSEPFEVTSPSVLLK